MMTASRPSEDQTAAGRSLIGKLVVLVAVVVLAGLAYWQFGAELSLARLAEREAQLRRYQQEHPLLTYGLAFLAYVTVTGLSLPGAAGLTLLYGWYFGLWPGVVLVSFASTTGATVAFLLSRHVAGNFVQQRFAERLAGFNRAFEREGPSFLFSLRLIPLVPFFVINLVMGLTPIHAATFWWVSQLGMLPGTLAYVYAGSSVPDIQWLADNGIRAVFQPRQLVQLFVAFGLLAVLPFLLRWVVYRVRRWQGRNESPTESIGP